MRRAAVFALVALGGTSALTGCNATLDDPGVASPDAALDTPSTLPDGGGDASPPPPDVAMLDCATGGDARAVDSSTNTCIIYFGTPVTHANARIACDAIGTKLVVIKSAATNTVVTSLVTDDAFIGATDIATEGTWLWLENAADPLVFTNWRAGEPNNGGTTGEDCGVLEPAGTWDDRPCAGTTGTYTFVCQRAAP